MQFRFAPALAGLAVVFSLSLAQAEDGEYSPGVDKDHPKNVYWGDTHLHTQNSADAYSLMNTMLSPDDAYRFARGEELTAHNGMRVRLRRPLDFLVVSDHASYLGGYYRFFKGDPLVVDTEVGKRWSSYENPGAMFGEFTGSINDPENFSALPEESIKAIWQDVADVSDRNNMPGQFTALTGYEWTSMIDGNNLHRVIVFKDGADIAGQMRPFSAHDSTDPEDLWAALAEFEERTGGKALSIPHNGNLSNGMMFSNKTIAGEPLTKAYAETRARWEPIYEVTQVKGDGEAHPILSPNDEFADFENWDWDNIGRTEPKEDWMLPQEYARGALKLGLKYEAELGANPFKFGLIGSTDSHTSLATAAEDNFFGKFPESEPGPERFENVMAGALWQNWRIVASGLAAVWATENTRDALFEAMQRREVYATTGSRITVRFFGGWEYDAKILDRPDYVEVAYAQGVPMGGDLTSAPDGKAPTFIAVAAKDPDGANLDRVQIIKGWLDADGNVQEKIYELALSDGRKVKKKTGKAKPVGNTVDVEDASYTNSIGDPQLSAVWTDPDFDASERAFYYVRVIEIPTPRWSAYDAKFFDLDLPDDVPMVIQDRAYTSPIWYTP